MAISGKVPESVMIRTRSVDFVREGNRILLDQLEVKERMHEIESHRDASNTERIVLAFVGFCFAIVSAFVAVKAMRLWAARVGSPTASPSPG
jgi:hypothetical protein